MNASARLVRFEDSSMWVELSDGRAIGVPLAWFPRLMQASREQLEACEISQGGLPWEALDEDVSIAGLLAGRGDVTHAAKAAA